MRALPVYDSIICFGDSLTQQASQRSGFVASLQNLYQRRLEVVSRGFSGYTSRQAIALCPQLFRPDDTEKGTKARLAIIWFGTNDCISSDRPQHVPLEEYQTNTIKVLEHFAATDAILITPATVVPGRFGGHEDDTSMIEYGQTLSKVAQQVNSQRTERGEKGFVQVVDMNKAFRNAAEKIDGGLPSLHVDDGLHISSKGYQVVFETLQQAIIEHFPSLNPDQLPFIFPPWDKIFLSADEKGQRAQLQPRLT